MQIFYHCWTSYASLPIKLLFEKGELIIASFTPIYAVGI